MSTRPRPHSLSLAGVLLVAVASGSCAAFERILAQPGGIGPPTITFRGATLAQAPAQRALAAYYCPRFMREKLPVGAAADFACAQFFGPSPRPQDVQVAFDLHFLVANPNQLPLPLSSILTAVTVFPQTNQQRLGTLCLRLCAPENAACSGGADPHACDDQPGDVRTMQDFPRAIANLLISQGLRSAAGQPVQFTVPPLLEGASAEVIARFAFLPESLLPLFEELARRSANQLKEGQTITFSMPYRVEGTVFADAGSLGRVAAGFGPISGEWVLPPSPLLP